MGSNGSGKTTILESIVFALTGKSPDKVDNKDWVNKTLAPAFEAGVEMELKNLNNG